MAAQKTTKSVGHSTKAFGDSGATASRGGGHILASSNSLHPAVDPANYRAMVRTARTFGRYPPDPNFLGQYWWRKYVEKFLDQAGE